MMSPILHVALQKPLRHCFDYLPPVAMEKDTPLQPGIRLLVPFGKQQLIGILLKVNDCSCIEPTQLRPALQILDQAPLLPEFFLLFCQWIAQYYHYSIGEILLTNLPAPLRQLSPKKDPLREILPSDPPFGTLLKKTPHSLNADQQHAVQAITRKSGFQPYLLEGVTGSGKTEVYLQSIEKILQQGKQALVLVPEIGLTPQTLSRFEQRFNIPVMVLHSAATPRTRLKTWLAARDGKPLILIGTRSAIFVPLANLGIIVVDEEHDLSFKQQTHLRYSARDLAIVLGQMRKIPVVLGSATPTLESFYNVKQQRYQGLPLPNRAGGALFPTFQIVDLRQHYLTQGLSKPLLQAMTQHLAAGNQVLLFLNRRGYAPVLLCQQCGWSAQCRLCDARFTLHQHPARLICHHCTASRPIPQQCEACDAPVITIGLGTEQLEEGVRTHFANIPLVRMDRDAVRSKKTLEQLLTQIHTGGPQILIGTQMLAKGHHFPKVTLVGIIEIDGALYSSDFRANERLAQSIVQVAGRAGREDKPGQVYIQTYCPQHPLLQLLLSQGYAAFAEQALSERAGAKWPPFQFQALFRAESQYPQKSLQLLTQIKALAQPLASHLSVLGPIPSSMERKAGKYRALLLLQSPNRSLLQNTLQVLLPQVEDLKLGRNVRWSLDIDPQEMF
ncbi:MAG: primosomal protein N' [Gammaproteobacteria bacterium]